MRAFFIFFAVTAVYVSDIAIKKREAIFYKITSRLKKAAAAYSPTTRSTIGAAGLNFSVRKGKRCIPGAITT